MDDELLNDFLAEAEDILERVGQLMDELGSRPPTIEDIDELFRSIHTVKGGAGMFGWNNTLNTGHTLETYLGKCKNDISLFDYDYVRDFVDLIENLLEANDEMTGEVPTQSEESNDRGELGGDTLKYNSVLFSDFFETFPEIVDGELQKGAKFFEFKVSPSEKEDLIIELENLGIEKFSEEDSGDEVDILVVTPNTVKEDNPIFEKIGKLNNYLEISALESESSNSETVELVEAEKANEEGVKEVTEKSSSQKVDLLRVPTTKVNQALNSVWEIFLLRNQMAYLFEKNKEFLRGNIDMIQEWEMLDNALKRNIAELESTTMGMRMSDLSSLFTRMKKVVRSYQKTSGKKINFETHGDEIELDKKVIDMLGEPLIHLVRNAMDHGIECPEDRAERNKPTEGQIKLSARSLSDKVIITIEDDGKGIDAKAILASAKKKGIDTSQIKTDQEAISLIFSAGFSTAEVVTDVSGRGVGMDAVIRSIEKLGGDVFIETKIGKGSLFHIELPLSMSVVSSILFEVNGKSYGSSINNLVEICRGPASDLQHNNGDTLFPYRGEFLECFDLRNYFSGNPSNDEKGKNQATICVLTINGVKAALRVDRVFKHTEIVVKEMKGVFPSMDCVNGVSILATGEPIFVVSLTKIYNMFKEKGLSHAA